MRSNQRNMGVSVLARAASILNAFEPEERDLGISELARRTGLAKSTVSRLLTELVALNLLERSGTTVRLGMRLFELGEHATRPRDLRKAALAHMTDLSRATGQTVHLAVLEGVDVIYIQILRAHRAPALPSRVGGRMPAHATGLGKALLAHADAELVDRVLRGGLRRVGPRTITDPTVLRRELERIRSTSIAYEKEESGPHVACAASAVVPGSGPALAAISVSGWSGRLDTSRVGPAVRLAALGIARVLEHPRDAPRPDDGLRAEVSDVT